MRRLTLRKLVGLTIAAVLVTAPVHLMVAAALTGWQPHKGMVVAVIFLFCVGCVWLYDGLRGT